MARGHSVLFASNADLCTLLEAVASGVRKAFRTLYDKSAPVLFGICVRLMRDRDKAQDVFQEAMTRIWRKAHLFDASKGNAYGVDGRGYPQLRLEPDSRRAAAFLLARRSMGAGGDRGKAVRRSRDRGRCQAMFEEAQ